MRKKTTPFWVEGMSAKEREHQVSSLFALLEQKFSTIHNATDVVAKRTFVFVPDPPPLTFEAQIQGFEVRCVSWGIAGRAVATETVQIATALASAMFDLWSDSLYVLVFEAEAPDDTTLGRWIAEVLRVELDVAPNAKMLVPLLPNYVLIVFDWGDLVGEVSTEK